MSFGAAKKLAGSEEICFRSALEGYRGDVVVIITGRGAPNSSYFVIDRGGTHLGGCPVGANWAVI